MSDILNKVLVTGSGGMAGSYVDFGIKTEHRSMDVSDLKEVLSMFEKHKPRAVLHLAAETDVDRCERDPDYAYKVNAIGTYNLAYASKKYGAKLVYISTAGVFDGEKAEPYSETDEPNPQNYYGHSKFLGELAVKGLLKDYLILRVCWMVGGGPAKDQKFVAKIIQQLLKKDTKEIKAVTDQMGTPTFAKDLIKAAKILIEKDEKGIFHLANGGKTTRYGVAEFVVKYLGAEVKMIPVDSASFGLDAKRTKNEALSSKVNLMRPWEEALEEYLSDEWKEYFKKNHG